MWRSPSNPQYASRIQASSLAATGHPCFQVERAITEPGAGEVTREANPLPGRAGSWSGRLNRRWTSSAGVRRTSPKPSAVLGSTRMPSHRGGARPTMGLPLSLGFRGDFDAVGDGELLASPRRRLLAR